MNKTKMILAVTGGTIGVAVLGAAFFAWSAYSAKTEAIDGGEETAGLEAEISQAQSLARKPVFPGASSVSALEANRSQLAEWHAEAFALAAHGDRSFEPTTPAAFKAFLIEDAKRLAALPGAVAGALVKPDFAFGPFREYIAEGRMPDVAQLPTLQRMWDDVSVLAATLASCGVSELQDIQRQERAEAQPKETANRRGAKNRRAAAEPEVIKPAANTYLVTFLARPAACVKAVNALATGERFTVVEGFSFGRAGDVIAEALGEGKKKGAERTSSRRRRRMSAAEEEAARKAEEEAAARGCTITSPATDAPLTVTMTVTVYDFHSRQTRGGADAEDATAK